MSVRHLSMFVPVALCLWIYSLLYFELHASCWLLVSTNPWVLFTGFSAFLLTSVGPITCVFLSVHEWWTSLFVLMPHQMWISNTDTQGWVNGFRLLVQDRAVGVLRILTQRTALSSPGRVWYYLGMTNVEMKSQKICMVCLYPRSYWRQAQE